MKRGLFVAFLASLCLLGVLWSRTRYSGARAEALAESRAEEPGRNGGSLLDAGSLSGRTPLEVANDDGLVPSARLPEGRRVPENEAELAELVAWMRGLGHDELLRLSNAEFDFEKSELIEMLQGIEGSWVVPALGELATAETDPLLKAVLVTGLVGGFQSARVEDERMLPILDTLMTQMGRSAGDPYQVAQGLALTAFCSCRPNDVDYALFMGAHLRDSDNGLFLTMGYTLMGKCPGAESLLKGALFQHAHPNGRLGGLEGLRSAATSGRVSASEITTVGLAALEAEADERNRLLLYEMLVSAGGEEGVSAVEGIVREGEAAELRKAAGFLAMKMAPDRALALFHDVLGAKELDAETRQAVYDALGLVQGEEGADYLLGLARDEELAGEERLAGLRGLWNRPVDERLAGELRNVFDTAEDGALRTEALRMLVVGEGGGADIDLREVGTLDEDATVRAEAVVLAAMQPAELGDTRDWLEQRMLQDDSYDVKAAALGALVFQAHYAGDGDGVLEHLRRARRFTDDEEALAMIAEGERMVRDHDPRRIDLELAREAEFMSTLTRYTSGPAQLGFQRRSRQIAQIVSSLRAPSR